MSLKVVKNLKANGGGAHAAAICALQNCDKGAGAPPRIGTAVGAANVHFKRLPANFQSGGSAWKCPVTTISAAQSDSD